MTSRSRIGVMVEDKIVPGEESFDQENSDDETTDDESDVSEDCSVTGESYDERPFIKTLFANRKMYLIECIGKSVESIEKDMEELEVRRTKVTCPTSLTIIDGQKKLLLDRRERMQKRLEEVKHGLQPVQESLKEDNQTLTDLKIEINTDEKNENLMMEHVDLQVKV
ncbi:uncharacterized protein LOC125865544 isoform X2 [Solanum stenotomum]|uniref:uncharacterized protein LOC125865544 isoform X2 n=1 Tax=Solanum stenotomum TaxID=172797 RepID=UPI0020D122F9|nr:uncharacterized protein LOC125865544 isoform X2 [Solanum stenotomum]